MRTTACSLLAPPTVSAIETARETCTASPPAKKSANPNGLLMVACTAWPARPSMLTPTDWPAATLLVTHRALALPVEQQHQAGIEIGLQRLLREPAVQA